MSKLLRNDKVVLGISEREAVIAEWYIGDDGANMEEILSLGF